MHAQGDTLLLADIFENFRNVYLKRYELDPEKFLALLGLAWQASLKRTKVKLDLLTDTDMLLRLEKGLREGICDSIYKYATANNKYTKNYDKNKESSYLQCWDGNNLNESAMSQKLPVNNTEWIKDLMKI